MSIGVSYFGNRILRHVAADMEGLAADGFDGVLHTYTENELAYYRESMGRIVAVSHDAGLEVQIAPWGVAQLFGGEAESRFTAFNPDAGQVLDDGRATPAGCPNNPAVRSFVRAWADAAIDTGADHVFWDEPHWVHPEHFGLDQLDDLRLERRADVGQLDGPPGHRHRGDRGGGRGDARGGPPVGEDAVAYGALQLEEIADEAEPVGDLAVGRQALGHRRSLGRGR